MFEQIATNWIRSFLQGKLKTQFAICFMRSEICDTAQTSKVNPRERGSEFPYDPSANWEVLWLAFLSSFSI